MNFHETEATLIREIHELEDERDRTEDERDFQRLHEQANDGKRALFVLQQVIRKHNQRDILVHNVRGFPAG